MAIEKQKSIKVFYCYAHEDKDLRDELERHLGALSRSGQITCWYDREIEAGTEWEKEIEEQLDTAGIILLLISSDFIHSDYCYSKEMQRAIKLHKEGRARAIPIILRPVDWQSTPIALLQVLPSEGKPVTSSIWNSRDEAFYDIAKGIRKVVNTLLTQPQQTQLAQAVSDTLSPKRQQSSGIATEAHVALDRIITPIRRLAKSGQKPVVISDSVIPWEELPDDVREELIRREQGPPKD